MLIVLIEHKKNVEIRETGGVNRFFPVSWIFSASRDLLFMTVFLT